MVNTVSDREFTEKVLRSPEPVLVACGASWCMPSRDLIPIIDEIASEFEGRVKVVAVDIDKETAIGWRLRVNRVPVTMMIDGGKVVDFIGGMTSKKNISEMVAKRLQPVIEVGEHNFDREVLECSLPTLVHFHAGWCAASELLLPVIGEISKRFRGRAKVARVEFGPQTAQLCGRFGVMRVPTLQLFVNGQLEDQILGAMVGGTKVGAVETSCVGLRTADNIGNMLSRFVL